MTEGRIADSLLIDRFERPPASSSWSPCRPHGGDSGPGGELLDALIATADSHPNIRGTLSWRTARDSTFLARDGRSTFFVVSIAGDGDDAARLVMPLRQAFDSILRRSRDRDAYRVRVPDAHHSISTSGP